MKRWFLLAALAAAATASAHHGGSEYQADKPLQLTGTIQEAGYVQPHGGCADRLRTAAGLDMIENFDARRSNNSFFFRSPGVHNERHRQAQDGMCITYNRSTTGRPTWK
ncbi:DUF6152 family protein [Massilia aerilata]|uniref:DUF6152 family protein n=1 Tax=Massilia aerilata TaxID=453817 RepID=A0ABW0RS93_9BURK